MPSQSLHGRFQSAVIGAAAALATVVAVSVYFIARAHYVESGEASVRSIVAAVQQTLAVGVYARDEVLLKELVEGLTHHPSVARVGVRDVSGAILAAKSADTGATSAPVAAQRREKAAFESRLMSPFNSQEAIGHLDIWVDYDRLRVEAGRQAALLVGALVVMLAGVLTVFNTLARRMLSRPMHQLAGELAGIEPGTADRMSVDSRHEIDEVGKVTSAVNRLLEMQQIALERERGMRTEIAALEARYRGIFDSTSAGIFILSAEGKLLQSNPAFGRLLDVPIERLQAVEFEEFARTFFSRPAQLLHLIDQSRHSLEPEVEDLELVRSNGDRIWVHCMVSCREDPDTLELRVEGVLYDITRRKVQEKIAQHRAEHDALTGLKSRAYIEALLGQHVGATGGDKDNITLMFIDLDGFKSVNDRWGHAAGDAVLIESAQRLRALFQRSCDVIGRLGGDELVVMITGVEATDASVADLAGRLIDSFKVAFVLPNGESARVGASVGVASYPLHATSVKTLLHAADAAMYAVKQSGKGGFVIAEAGAEWAKEESAEWQKAISSLVVTSKLHSDPLTGLMDRRHLIEQLTSEYARVAGGCQPTGVICLDIDGFKLINVAHGTHIGDEVLCETSRRLRTVLRRGDSLARTGSDEFVVVLPSDGSIGDDSRGVAECVAAKLLESFNQPFSLSQGTFNIRASAGVSLIDSETVDGLDALREAQLALRRSKTLGSSNLVFFENDMLAGFQDRLALEEDLQAAIGSEQMFLHVQPQHDAQGVLIGGEALLRWKHPTRGMVPPDQFIALAEASGVIIELGRWVLDAGCAILAQMRQNGGTLSLAINISPAQFNHPDFVEEVKRALQATGAPADGLILEITEGLLITNVQRATDRLREIVDIGVRFSIDDFGTGFSSLSYLRQLPLYEIKIDRSFITGLPSDTASVGIVNSILSMGSHLGLHVVAEGVETLEQANFLIASHCAAQQGWLHGRPMAARQFLELVNSDVDSTST